MNRLIIVGPPLVQLLLFGYAATLDLTRVDYAVLDHDRTITSRELVSKFTGSGIFKEVIRVESEQEASAAIGRRRIRMNLVIPQNFERDLKSGKGAAVQVLLDGRNSSTAGTALSYAQNVITSFNYRYHGAAPALKLEQRAWYNKNFEMRHFMIPALLATIALLNVMMLTSLSIAREREEGTFDQLLVAPYAPVQILMAKAVANIMIGAMQLFLSFLIARYWFEVPFRGSYLLLVITCLFFLASATSSGILISVFCKNLQQAMLGTFIISVPFAILSGFTAPVENMPEFFQFITLINPVRFAIMALQEIFLEGAAFHRLLHPIGMMAGIAVVTFTTAVFSLKKLLSK